MMQITDENSLKDFECPVCYNYLSRPIYQCPTGHSVCANCKDRINRCYCQKEYGDTRNYVLENITEKIRVACKYKECNQLVQLSQFSKHAADCSHADIACKGGAGSTPCNWKGLSTSLIEHIKTEHKAHLVCNSSELKSHQLAWSIIEYEKQLFWVKRYFEDVDPVIVWTVQSALPLPADVEYTLTVQATTSNGTVHEIKQPCSNNPQENEEKLKSSSFMAMRKRKAKGCIFRVSINKFASPIELKEEPRVMVVF